MDMLLKKLKEYGADTVGAMSRFLDDIDLYKSCFKTILYDGTFQKLEESIKAKNYENAFDNAHTLKGTTGNMGLTPLYKILCDMVEELRKHEYTNLENYYDSIEEQYSFLLAIQLDYGNV